MIGHAFCPSRSDPFLSNFFLSNTVKEPLLPFAGSFRNPKDRLIRLHRSTNACPSPGWPRVQVVSPRDIFSPLRKPRSVF